jgi:hypothetical protein
VYTFGSEYAYGGVPGSKETEDDDLPMWDRAHAENSETSSLRCVASCEKDGKMVRNLAELSVKINERNHLCMLVCIRGGYGYLDGELDLASSDAVPIASRACQQSPVTTTCPQSWPSTRDTIDTTSESPTSHRVFDI